MAAHTVARRRALLSRFEFRSYRVALLAEMRRITKLGEPPGCSRVHLNDITITFGYSQ